MSRSRRQRWLASFQAPPGTCSTPTCRARPGGTGEQFDWQFWPEPGSGPALKLALAGGLTPDNVARAVEHLHPDAVDVSGGVEGARKGEKDAAKIRAFVAAVRAADEDARTSDSRG